MLNGINKKKISEVVLQRQVMDERTDGYRRVMNGKTNHLRLTLTSAPVNQGRGGGQVRIVMTGVFTRQKKVRSSERVFHPRVSSSNECCAGRRNGRRYLLGAVKKKRLLLRDFVGEVFHYRRIISFSLAYPPETDLTFNHTYDSWRGSE